LTTGGHHYVETMSNADRDNAIATATQFVNQDIPALDSGFMVPNLTVRVVAQAPRLSPDGGNACCGMGGWWPDPGDTASQRDPAFDSVIVVWNAHGVDESNHQVDITHIVG